MAYTLVRVVLVGTALLVLRAGASAEWKAANADMAAAAKDAEIAAVLEAVNGIDDALIQDDHAAFAAFLAKDLVVNNPQNGISRSGATGTRNASGLIRYSRYLRSVEYAGKLGDLVVLMGEERVVPKGDAAGNGKEVRRRFTDVWRREGGRWLLALRQATVVEPYGGPGLGVRSCGRGDGSAMVKVLPEPGLRNCCGI